MQVYCVKTFSISEITCIPTKEKSSKYKEKGKRRMKKEERRKKKKIEREIGAIPAAKSVGHPPTRSTSSPDVLVHPSSLPVERSSRRVPQSSCTHACFFRQALAEGSPWWP
jgi:hypothetical protein